MIVVANWKAYVDEAEKARKLYRSAKRLANATRVKIVLAPSFPHLGMLSPKNDSKVQFASQDISVTTGGAHTGEVTAGAVRSVGATYALIGHSERRAVGDTKEIIQTKLEHAIAHGLKPILCVGESERDANGAYLGFIREQIVSALEPLPERDRMEVVVAYEPLWAIGKTAVDAISSADLAELTLYIRKVLAELFPGKAQNSSTVLYGGSVEPENIRGLAGGSGVEGFLVGHASADLEMFTKLVKALA